MSMGPAPGLGGTYTLTRKEAGCGPESGSEALATSAQILPRTGILWRDSRGAWNLILLEPMMPVHRAPWPATGLVQTRSRTGVEKHDG